MKKLLLASAISAVAASAATADIKVGVLHSLSGTMAISETTLKDTMLMLIDQQNAKGGINGEMLEAVVVDPASDWPLFAEKARELLTVHEVDVIFGNWTSVSRKSVLPVIEELNGLLFYLFSTKAKSLPRTSSTPVLRQTNRRSQQLTTTSKNWVLRNSLCWVPTMFTHAPPTRSLSNT